MLPEWLPGDFFMARPTWFRPWGRCKSWWRDYIYILDWKHLGVEKRISGTPCLACYSHDQDPNKQQKMDRWMDGWPLLCRFIKAVMTAYLLKPSTDMNSMADSDRSIGNLLWEAATLWILYQSRQVHGGRLLTGKGVIYLLCRDN